MKNTSRINMTTLLFLAALASAKSAEQQSAWPCWRGPFGDCSAQASLPAVWPAELNLRWKASVAQGYSAPVVAEARVYIQARTEEQESVTAYNAETGTELWRWKQPVAKPPKGEVNGADPAATPNCFEKRLYLHSVTCAVICLDAASGAEIWKRDMAAELKNDGPQYGTAASPLVLGGAVVLPVGGNENGKVVAFDLATGKTIWEGGTSPPGYGSPAAGKLAGEDQLLVFGLKDLQGFRKADGRYEKAWSFDYFAGEGNQSTPAIAGPDMVIVTSEINTQGLRVERDGKSLKATSLWTADAAGNMSSPLIYENRIYLHSLQELLCLSPADGKVLSRLPNSGVYCSLVRSGATLLCLSNDAKLRIVDASQPVMRQLHEYTLSEEQAWGHLAVVGDLLFIRSRSELRCLSWNAAPPPAPPKP